MFTPARIIGHGLSKEDIKSDLARRTTHKLPPGYKDSGKLDEGVGDVLIWHSLKKIENIRINLLYLYATKRKAIG
jgi:hypothetical protein